MITLLRTRYFQPGALMDGSSLAACAFGLAGCWMLLAVFATHLHLTVVWTALEYAVLALCVTIVLWWIPAFCLLLAGYFCRHRRAISHTVSSH